MLCMWLLLLDKALLSSCGTSCIDRTIFDINMKIMSRTTISETANLSGNRQSEHLYYHYSIKKFKISSVSRVLDYRAGGHGFDLLGPDQYSGS